MHNSLSWSNSPRQHNSWSQRSSSTGSQRTTTSHKTEYSLDYTNASMEEMDWSDTCLADSNNSLTSPAALRGQLSHSSGSWKNKENTSPSSLLSSLNITEFQRPQNITESFASPKVLQNFEVQSAHRPIFQMPQSMLKASALNLSLAKMPDLSSASVKLKLPLTASKFQTSSMSLPTFHRTVYHSFHSVDQNVNPSACEQDAISSALRRDTIRDSLVNESVMKDEDETCAAGDDISSEGSNSLQNNNLENKLPTIDIKKPRRSACSCLFRVSFCSVLAVLVVFIAMSMVPRSYFQLPVCDTKMNVSLVRRTLTSNVFGQHLAVEVVSERLGQLLKDGRKNLLVLSFQGWTGIGKNHMSNILARFVPPTNSHRYIVTLHFASNAEHDMDDWMRSEVMANCGIHLFVIDEMDKASDALVSGLRKALHYAKEYLSNQLHTKAIVLLLSNTGSTAINAYTAQVLEEGVLRENIELDGVVERLQTTLPHTWYSELLREKLVDQIVPFLPLEKTHVEKCATAALRSRQVEVRDEIISAVLKRLSYFPLSNSRFSTTGCRKVNAELDLVLY